MATFLNPSFELDDNSDGIPDGWSVNLSRFIAGQTFTIAGTSYTAPIDPTYPTNNATRGLGDDDTASLTYTSSLNLVTTTDGGKSLKLDSSGSSVSYGVVRGPWIYSSEFSVTGGQDLTFDWQALGGGDAFDVFGFLLNTRTGATQIVLNETGGFTKSDGSGTWARNTGGWQNASVTVNDSGDYRFVFLSGSFDQSGGTALGATLYLDNFSGTAVTVGGGQTADSQNIEGAVVRAGVVNAFGNGVAAPTERQVTSDGSQNDSISGGPSLTLIDVEYTNVPGSTVYGQFSNGLSGYIGGSSELLSSAELIDLSRWSQSYKDLDAGRAHQSFVMNTQSTVQLLNELGAGNAIRYLYAGDFEVNGGDGTPKTFSISNTPTDGVTDVLNISRPGTEQFVLDLKGFTGMAITGPGVDVIGSDENNYVITDGAGTLEMGNGKDVIVMNNMNGVVDGGNDLDVARVFGNSFSVSVVENGGILYVTNGLGTTLFTSVEVLVLDNGYYKKDIASGGWQWVDQVAKELDAVSLIGVQGTGVDL